MGFIPALVGAVGTGLASAFGARQQQQASQAMAREQMAFQERMSSSAHQREVQDLMKAGLNPMLSVNAGESTPGGAMGQAQNVVGGGVSSAMQARQLMLDAMSTAAEVGLKGKQADLADAQKSLTDAQRNAMGGKQFVSDVASDARSVYQKFKDWISGVANPTGSQRVNIRGPKVLRAISSAKQQLRQGVRSDVTSGPGGRGGRAVSSDSLPFDMERRP